MKIQEILQLPDLDGLRIAYKIAQEAHKDQKRWGGEPYMTHIDAVIENTFAILINQYKWALDDEYYQVSFDSYGIVAAWHDILEDHPDKFSVEFLQDKLSDITKRSYKYNNVALSILAITKQDGEEYLSYLERVKWAPIARIVKLADLQHNMSDLAKHKKKDKLDKYKLAYYFLEH